MMAEEDIYKNKRSYERFMKNLEGFLVPAEQQAGKGKRRYHCKNSRNLKHFEELHRHFEARDLSYIRRGRLIDTIRFVMFVTDKELSACDRRDVDDIVARSHKTNQSIHSKQSFIKNLKWIWSTLFPEIDEYDHVIDNIRPYPVRHLTCRIDKSKQRLRNDRLTIREYERLVSYFSVNPEMQAYITIAVESLGRPQEICFTRIRDVEMHESYAKIWISSHGKEGTKFLQVIDSFSYLARWFSQHPHQGDGDSFLFLALDERDRQLTPENINKKLRRACRILGIDKRITAYSLKRLGVTFMRLRGDSDVEIQHVARWTSTRQLQTYDLSNAEDIFKKRLEDRGLVPKEDREQILEAKLCACGEKAGFSDKICSRCNRSLGSKKIEKEMKTDQEIRDVFAMAIENPNLSLAQIMEECRRRKNSVG